MVNLRIRPGVVCARLLCLAAVVTFCSAVPSSAQPGGNAPPHEDPLTTQAVSPENTPAALELRMGFMSTNLEAGGAAQENAPALNAEVLFARSKALYANPVTAFLLRPRLHLGGTLAPEGISDLYAGFTWERYISDRLFLEASFGSAVHDGPNSDSSDDSYGCAVLFRESASLGFDITERLRLIATVDHISNAGLCGENQGLTNAGVRLGYRW